MHIEIIGSLWGVPLAFEWSLHSQTLFNELGSLRSPTKKLNTPQPYGTTLKHEGSQLNYIDKMLSQYSWTHIK